MKILIHLTFGLFLSLLTLISCTKGNTQIHNNCSSITDYINPSSLQEERILLPIFQNQKWGFIDLTGKTIIEPQFDAVGPFSEDRAPFKSKIDGKWGFIDSTGQRVVEPRFDNADTFFGGRAVVKINNQFSFVDYDGKEVGDRFEQVSSFYEGRAFGKLRNGQWKMLDFSGFPVTQDTFSYIGNFSENLAAFSGRNNKKQSGFIDRNGVVAIDLKDILPNFESYGFSNGLASVYAYAPFRVEHLLQPDTWGKKFWGAIDRTGKKVIPLKYEYVSSFSQCLASIETNGRYGVINTHGDIIIAPQFEYIGDFSEGLAVVKTNQKFGYIAPSGQIAVEPKFSDAFSFSNGLALVKSQNGKLGFIDRNGFITIEPRFDAALPFKYNVARVEIGNRWGYINRGGNFIWTSTEKPAILPMF